MITITTLPPCIYTEHCTFQRACTFQWTTHDIFQTMRTEQYARGTIFDWSREAGSSTHTLGIFFLISFAFLLRKGNLFCWSAYLLPGLVLVVMPLLCTPWPKCYNQSTLNTAESLELFESAILPNQAIFPFIFQVTWIAIKCRVLNPDLF